MFNLTGKTAIVTGGNGGIGLGFARGLAGAGANVAIWGRNADKNEAARAELAELTDVLALQCDVGDEDEIIHAFAETVDRFGRVDSVFANAGIGARSTRFAEMTLGEWRGIFRVNMEGVFLTFRTAVQHMMEHQQGGSLVVTSSGSAFFGMPRGEHYAATKAGVNAVIRGLAVEYGKHGIRANAITPGWIDTDMTAPLLANERFERGVLPRIPMKRWGRPEDFEGIAVYLASDASAWHTGDVINIDGGYAVA
jgi:NAD(P)-dependent dehydrogenase (short-subunit alcohol dehydrogenase family)